jgi:hypothetical protein
MGGQSWLELELYGPAMGSSQERGKRGKEEGRQGARLGVAWGAARGGGGAVGAAPCFLYA